MLKLLLGAGQWIAGRNPALIGGVGIVFAIVLAALGGWLVVDHFTIVGLRADVQTITASRDSYAGQNVQLAANLKTAGDANVELEAAFQNAVHMLRDTVEAKAEVQRRAAATSASLAQAKAAIAAANKRVDNLLRAVYETDPACGAWGDLPVCAGVDQLLRANPP